MRSVATTNLRKFNYSPIPHTMNKLQFTLALGAMIAVGSLFMDDASSQVNRQTVRLNNAQLGEAIAFLGHMSSPMPGE